MTNLIKGKHAICAYVGEDHNHMRRLVEIDKLPAWRSSPHGTWKALSSHLDAWLEKQAVHYLRQANCQKAGE